MHFRRMDTTVMEVTHFGDPGLCTFINTVWYDWIKMIRLVVNLCFCRSFTRSMINSQEVTQANLYEKLSCCKVRDCDNHHNVQNTAFKNTLNYNLDMRKPFCIQIYLNIEWAIYHWGSSHLHSADALIQSKWQTVQTEWRTSGRHLLSLRLICYVLTFTILWSKWIPTVVSSKHTGDIGKMS